MLFRSVYGSSFEEGKISFNGVTGLFESITTYSFLEDSRSIALETGDIIEFDAIRNDYQGTPQLNVQIKSVVDEDYTAEKFATDFTDATTPVCSRAESERLTGLQSIWSELSAKYSALDSTERANLVSAEASSNVENAVARYDYICGKYNTSEHKVLEEFIEGATIVYNSLFVQLSNNNNNAMITTIVITSIASIALLGVTLFIKKRKATH